LKIVLVNTSAGTAYGSPITSPSVCGMGREATLYLTERGVRVTGTDGWSWDAPFVHTRRNTPRRTTQADLGRPSGRPRDRLLPYREAAHLEALPAKGFTVSCFR